MPSESVRVLCVDDHAFLAEGLKSRLALEPDLEFAGSVGTAANLLGEVRRARARIVLMDIEMPGPDPFEAIRDLRRREPDVRCIVLSAYVRDRYFEAAVEAGAWGYLQKGDDPDQIVDGIRRVATGEFVLSPEVERRCGLPRARGHGRPLLDRPASRLGLLTPREQQVLRLIGKGMSRTDIARLLHRSPKTVDAHQTRIMEKLDIHDRVELVRYAIREGLAEP
jgi:two-component system response regulator NreC